MIRTAELKLQPTAGQKQSLSTLLEFIKDCYNAALEERQTAWRRSKVSLTEFDQNSDLAGWDDPLSIQFGRRPTIGAFRRLNKAFEAFYRRCKTGEKPGYPRYKSRDRFDSVTYIGYGNCWKVDSDRFYIKGVGHIKYWCSIPSQKRLSSSHVKSLTLKRSGKTWRAYITLEVATPMPRPKTHRVVGIDLGVASLLTTSDGIHIDNPRYMKTQQEKTTELSQALARCKRGSKQRKRVKARYLRHLRKIKNQRADHHHKVSRLLVDTYDMIVHEDLSILNMVRTPAPKPDPEDPSVYLPNGSAAKAGLNKAILDAGWGNLLLKIQYKAAEAGIEIRAVDPRYTSQTCSRCLHVSKENRVTQADFRCQACGFTIHADINAAINILRLGSSLSYQTMKPEKKSWGKTA